MIFATCASVSAAGGKGATWGGTGKPPSVLESSVMPNHFGKPALAPFDAAEVPLGHRAVSVAISQAQPATVPNPSSATFPGCRTDSNMRPRVLGLAIPYRPDSSRSPLSRMTA